MLFGRDRLAPATPDRKETFDSEAASPNPAMAVIWQMGNG